MNTTEDKQSSSADRRVANRRARVSERRLLTEQAAARLLAVSPRTMFSLGKSGQVSRVMVGSSVRYDLVDLWEYVERQKT